MVLHKTCLVLGQLFMAATAFAGPQVQHEEKIAVGQGGFAGPLARSDRFGHDVTCIGDLDGDGVPDLAVGASQDDGMGESRGAVWILFLRPDGTVKRASKIGDGQGGFGGVLGDHGHFGTSVTSLGDLNGDHVVDLAVGAPEAGGGDSTRGALWILFLQRSGRVKAEQEISATQGGLQGPIPIGTHFGFSVAGLGDLDGDGTADLAVGSNDGVWILRLNADGTVGSQQRIDDGVGGFSGPATPMDRFGSAVVSLGDRDGDGIGDLAVGAFADDDGGSTMGADLGAVWILTLMSDGMVKTQQKISLLRGGFSGALEPGDRFGCSLEFPGDLDGDGVGDLLVGAIEDDDGGENFGAVWVLFLEPSGRVRTQRKLGQGRGGFGGPLHPYDLFGSGLAYMGDLDGDGTRELAVGARGDDGGERDQGAVWMLSLRPDLGSATVRNGTGINPSCYSSLDAPGVGSIWQPFVVTYGHSGPVTTWILGHAAGAVGRMTPAGEILVDLASPFLFSSVAAPTGFEAVHDIAVPNDPSLAGTFAATQALILSGGELELCNALDIVVGF